MDRTERQKLGIKRWLSSGGKGCMCWTTGSGKSRLALMTIQLMIKKDPTTSVLIVVPTDVLKNQWLNDYIIPNNLCNNCEVEIINTVVKKHYTCDLMVQDEAHRFVSDTFKQVFNSVEYRYILCLTATLERLDGKEELIKKYAPVCDTLTREEAIAEGWVSPVTQYVVLLDVDLTEYNQANKKFNSYFSFFNWDFQCAMSCLQDWKYRNKYAEATGIPVKEVMTMAADWMRALQLRKKFIASHPKKLEVCHKILEARKDKKCITFSSTISEAKKIKYGKTIHSQQKKKENAELLKEFNNATSGVINSSKALDAGVDVKGLSVGIVMNVDSSKITSQQRSGRVCRFEPNKQAEMFILVLKGTQETKWFGNSNTTKYTVINETQLEDVLNGKDIITRERDLIADVKFRF